VRFASEELRKSPFVVLAAMKHHPSALLHAHVELRRDPVFALEALRETGADVLRYTELSADDRVLIGKASRGDVPASMRMDFEPRSPTEVGARPTPRTPRCDADADVVEVVQHCEQCALDCTGKGSVSMTPVAFMRWLVGSPKEDVDKQQRSLRAVPRQRS